MAKSREITENKMVKIIITVEGDTKKHEDNKPKNIDNNTNDYDCHRIDVATENSCMEEIDTNIGEDLQQVDKAVVMVCTSIKKPTLRLSFAK